MIIVPTTILKDYNMKINYSKPLTVIIQDEVIKLLFPANYFITNFVFTYTGYKI